MKDFDQIFNTIREVSIGFIGEKEENFFGLAEAEIIELEKQYGLQFPLYYRHFLARMARGPLKIFDCQWYAIQGIANAHEVARELTTRDNYQLPEHAFPFSQWQGYQFYFFVNDGKDDPETFFYLEGGDSKAPMIVSDGSFSQWLIGLAISNTELYGRLLEKPVDEGVSKLSALLK